MYPENVKNFVPTEVGMKVFQVTALSGLFWENLTTQTTHLNNWPPAGGPKAHLDLFFSLWSIKESPALSWAKSSSY